MSHIEKMLWAEQYRPKSIDDLIVPERLKNQLHKGLTQNLLFYGPPGTGKTSAAKILAEDRAKKFIDCKDAGIDEARNAVAKFATTISIIGGEKKRKALILDEFDSGSEKFIEAMRGTIEKYEATTRFIATSNYINKISSGAKSRFRQIDFNFNEDEEKEVLKGYLKRIHFICKEQGMTITNDALLELVKRKFPDLRLTLNTLQGFYDDGIHHITIEELKKFSGVFKDVYELICSDATSIDNYKKLSIYQTKTDDLIASLGIDFIEYLQLERPEHKMKIGEIAIVVNDHSAKRNLVIDKYVNLLSLVYTLQQIIRK